MNKFLDKYELPTHKDLNNSHRYITINEAEAVIKCLPTKKSQGTDGFTVKFSKFSKEELSPMLFKLLI